MSDRGRGLTVGLLAIIAYELWRRRSVGDSVETAQPMPSSSPSSGVPLWIQALGNSYYGSSAYYTTYGSPGPFRLCAGMPLATPFVPYHQMTETGEIIQPPY